MTNQSPELRKAEKLIEDRKFRDAEELLASLCNAPATRTTASLLMYASTLQALGRSGQAVTTLLAAEALASDPLERASLLECAADLKFSLGVASATDAGAIIRLLERAIELSPTPENNPIRRKLCQAYLASVNPRGLYVQSKALLDSEGASFQAHSWNAIACYLLNRRAEGLAIIDAMLAHWQQIDNQQLYTLMELLVSYGAWVPLQSLMQELQARNRQPSWLYEFKARALIHDKEHQSALTVLDDVQARSITQPGILRSYYLLRGKCLDAIGDYAGAHASFSSMNQLVETEVGNIEAVDYVEQYRRLLPLDLVAHEDDEDAPYAPVFMVGFPRSGTTLLETVLGTQPGFATLGEADAISKVRHQMQSAGYSYPQELHKLMPETQRRLRETYFEHNEVYLESDGELSVVIDKLPLNIIHIPLILTLFPDSRFIWSLRHPADVCLSCFQQDFALNTEMRYFTSLESCFRRYNQVMDLFEMYRQQLSLSLHCVRYEDLVADFEGTILSLLEFLGVQPDWRFRDFHIKNEERLVITPSNSQVDQPIYTSARNRWRNYSAEVQPLLPIVQEQLARYGYSVTD